MPTQLDGFAACLLARDLGGLGHSTVWMVECGVRHLIQHPRRAGGYKQLTPAFVQTNRHRMPRRHRTGLRRQF